MVYAGGVAPDTGVQLAAWACESGLADTLRKAVVEPPPPLGQAAKKRQFKNLQDIVHDFAQELNAYCENHFFPSQINRLEFMKNLAGLSGYLREGADNLVVSLLMSASCAFGPDIDYAAKCVNEALIFDPKGRRLLIKILPGE